MGRALKTGLDYFPLDVYFLQNRKVRRIIHKHGGESVTALIAVLSLIYRERGYYTPWDEDICFDLCDITNIDMEKMNAIVADAIQADFFDEKQFRENGILTSKAIQMQYLTCTQKRKSVIIEESYALINKSSSNGSSGVISSPEISLSGEETPVCEPEMQQSKVKEIESKEKENQTTPLPPPKAEGVSDSMREWNEEILEMALYPSQQAYGKQQCDINAFSRQSDYRRIGDYLWASEDTS